MKKTRFTDDQMVTILRVANAKPIPEVAKKHGVAPATIYAWRKHFGGLEPTDVTRLRQQRQQIVLRPDRAYRLWRQAGLQVPRRRPRRRVATSRPRPLPPTAITSGPTTSCSIPAPTVGR